ncbi:MAG TPA: aconitase/3-isopropylmalate dehydratase large subunit family protein [Trueperaceae bacterium]
MSGKTISEKILSAKAGIDGHAGDLAVCEVDFALGTDASMPMAIDYYQQMGGERLLYPERLIVSLDHYAPAASARTANLHALTREFAAANSIRLFEAGNGIGHQHVIENGLTGPGDLAVGADSHSVTYGAFNAFATGIGSSDLAAVMISGRIWLKIPESIRVEFEGSLPAGVYPKDIVLALLKLLGSDGASYRTLEFVGGGASRLALEERLVLSNMSTEMGAKAAIFLADEKTERFLRERGRNSFEAIAPDPDAIYASTLQLDLSELVPLIARPHLPDNVAPVSEVAGTRVDMVFLGTCTAGQVRDFHEAHAVLKAAGGITPGVQLVITPSSRSVMERLFTDGTMADLLAMGALLTTPGCGACCGTAGAIPPDGANVISTANRNFKGRMGNSTASIFLASPATCGAAAATGRITDPREFLA